MERTDGAYKDAEDDYSVGIARALAVAEAQRISQAPPELRDEYALFTDDEVGVPNEVIAQIQDWTQEHCGFLPSFG